MCPITIEILYPSFFCSQSLVVRARQICCFPDTVREHNVLCTALIYGGINHYGF